MNTQAAHSSGDAELHTDGAPVHLDVTSRGAAVSDAHAFDESGLACLIDEVLKAERGPSEIAEELQVPLAKLPAILGRSGLDSIAESWRDLHELRASLLISQLRSSAAIRLAQFLAGEDSEPVRRACVDLLKAGVPGGRAAARDVRADSPWPSPPPAEIEAALLAELARLGRAELQACDEPASDELVPAAKAES